MHFVVLNLLAQMDHERIQGSGTPDLSAESSYVWPWVIAGLLLVGILLVTFKTSRRNNLEND
jgi:hypothetical protein